MTKAEKIPLNEGLFTEGKGLDKKLKSKIDEFRGRLEEIMAEKMSPDGLNEINSEIKRQLNDSIPEKFKSEYRSARDDREAAQRIRERILTDVNDFVLHQLNEADIPQNPA